MPKKSNATPTFESSIEKLESIVSQMEEENLPLEELLSNYEKGHELLTHCQSLIDSARKRIEVVQLDNSNSDDGTENKLASKPSTGDTPSSEASSDDIRLL
ncbi:MAG: exodeoxyribonuclease VII small subunit [Roseibacillus sp.]